MEVLHVSLRRHKSCALLYIAVCMHYFDLNALHCTSHDSDVHAQFVQRSTVTVLVVDYSQTLRVRQSIH